MIIRCIKCIVHVMTKCIPILIVRCVPFLNIYKIKSCRRWQEVNARTKLWKLYHRKVLHNTAISLLLRYEKLLLFDFLKNICALKILEVFFLTLNDMKIMHAFLYCIPNISKYCAQCKSHAFKSNVLIIFISLRDEGRKIHSYTTKWHSIVW